jgi:hypothetical protein
MNTQEATALRRPFPPESIGQLPKGGTMLDYVGHAAVTDRLLTVDPEWSWEPFALTDAGLPALDGSGNLWIRLTVCGVTRIGVGDGKNAKEVIGDAIRNAAMRFGVALDLWAKENLVEFAQAAQAHRPPPAESPPPKRGHGDGPAPLTDKQLKMMGALMSKRGLTVREDALAYVESIIGRAVASRNELTSREASQVIDALNTPIEESAS